MSQLFNNYLKTNIGIPDNTTKFLRQSPDYKDVIILGGDIDHTFELSPTKSEMASIEISYKQGTEIKLTKTFYTDLFEREVENYYIPDGEDEDVGEWYYPDGSAKLIVFDSATMKKIYEEAVERGRYDVYNSVLFYKLTPAESLLFNNYNRDMTVQARITYADGCIEFSDIFKVRIVDSILPEEE